MEGFGESPLGAPGGEGPGAGRGSRTCPSSTRATYPRRPPPRGQREKYGGLFYLGIAGLVSLVGLIGWFGMASGATATSGRMSTC